EPKMVGALLTTFESDWKAIEAQTPSEELILHVVKAARKAVKAVLKDAPALGIIAGEAVRKAEDEGGSVPVDSKEIERKVAETVRDAIREAVEEAVEGGQQSNGQRERETKGVGRIAWGPLDHCLLARCNKS